MQAAQGDTWLSLHSSFFFQKADHQVFIVFWRDDLLFPFDQLHRVARAEVGADPASQTEFLIDHGVVPFHLDRFDLAMIHALFASVAFFAIESGHIVRGGHRMFQMVVGDPFQETAATSAAVADERRLVLNIVSNVNQPKVLCLF